MSTASWSSAHSNRTGWAGRFVFVQSIALVFVAVWSLGGRAEGAIPLIAVIAWSSALALLVGKRAWFRLSEYLEDTGNFTLLIGWVVLILLLLLAPFNAEGTVVTTAEGIVYEPRDFIAWLPSTLVMERCQEYGWLLSGLLVQAAMLWLFIERITRVRQLITWMALNAALAAVLGAGFRLLNNDQILGVAESVHVGFFGPFRYHNHWTAFALLSMGQALFLVVYWFRVGRVDTDVRRKKPEFFWIAVLLILSMTLPMTQARAGVLFLALFWIALVISFVRCFLGGQRIKSSKVVARLTPVLGVIALLAVVCGSIWLSSPQLQGELEQTLEQIDQAKAGEYSSIEWARTDSWGDCWRMFLDRPMYGAGFGSHRYLYQLYAKDEYRYENGMVEHIKEFAHNDWMQYLAELGVIGCLLLIAPAVFLIKRYWAELCIEPHCKALLLPVGLLLLLGHL